MDPYYYPEDPDPPGNILRIRIPGKYPNIHNLINNKFLTHLYRYIFNNDEIYGMCEVLKVYLYFP